MIKPIIKPNINTGDLVEVIQDHRIPNEITQTYTRIWAKGRWPYVTNEDTLIPKGLICLVLEAPEHFDLCDVWFLYVLIENSSLGFNHFMAHIDASKVKRISKP